ncbi:MAG: hypothetical protein QXJ73_08000 [Candidatus Caldarchaeum sp.]
MALFGPIKLEVEKRWREKRLVIKGRWYGCLGDSDDGGVFEVGLDSLLEAGNLHTGHIPKNVIIRSRMSRQPLQLNFYFTRKDVFISAWVANWPYLADSSVFIERVSVLLNNAGWKITAKYEDQFKALLNGGGHSFRGIVSEINQVMEEAKKSLEEENSRLRSYVEGWVKWLQNITGREVAEASSLTGPLKIAVSVLYPAAIAEILFGLGYYNVSFNVASAILKPFSEHKELALSTLKELGIIRFEDGKPVPTPLWRVVAEVIAKAATSRSRPAYTKKRLPNPIELLSFVRRNIRSVAAQHSPSIRKTKNMKLYMDKLRMVEEKAERLTLAHIIVLTNLHMGRDLDDIFAFEKDELAKLGLISSRGRIRPQGMWVIRLVKNFTENVMQTSWQKVWAWGDEALSTK